MPIVVAQDLRILRVRSKALPFGCPHLVKHHQDLSELVSAEGRSTIFEASVLPHAVHSKLWKASWLNSGLWVSMGFLQLPIACGAYNLGQAAVGRHFAEVG